MGEGQRVKGNAIPAQAGAVVGVADGETGHCGGKSARRKRDWGTKLPCRAGWWRRAIGRRARVGWSTEGRAAVDGRTQPVRPLHDYSYGTTEKIKRGRRAAFSSSFLPLLCQALVANKRFISFTARFRTFLGLPNLTKFYQILPIFTKNVQREASNRGLNGGFW